MEKKIKRTCVVIMGAAGRDFQQSRALSPAKQGITSLGNYNAHRLPTRSDVHYGFMYPFDFQADRKRWSLLLQPP